jgi:SHS2 domain-containing protein
MKTFEILDISGDVGIKAYGKSLKDTFIHSAIGLYSLITDLDTVKEKKTIYISVESDSREGLLVLWLNELIFHFDAYGFVGKKIIITEFTPSLLKASLSGEDFDPERHEKRLLVKAATYHRLRIEKKDDTWEVDVIFDI